MGHAARFDGTTKAPMQTKLTLAITERDAFADGQVFGNTDQNGNLGLGLILRGAGNTAWGTHMLRPPREGRELLPGPLSMCPESAVSTATVVMVAPTMSAERTAAGTSSRSCPMPSTPCGRGWRSDRRARRRTSSLPCPPRGARGLRPATAEPAMTRYYRAAGTFRIPCATRTPGRPGSMRGWMPKRSGRWHGPSSGSPRPLVRGASPNLTRCYVRLRSLRFAECSRLTGKFRGLRGKDAEPPVTENGSGPLEVDAALRESTPTRGLGVPGPSPQRKERDYKSFRTIAGSCQAYNPPVSPST